MLATRPTPRWTPLVVCQRLHIQYIRSYPPHSGPGTSVGIATDYELDGPGIECRCGRDFPHMSRPALGHFQPPVQWVPGFPGTKELPRRDADPSAPSSVVVKKEYSYTSTPPIGRTAFTEPQCL